MNRREVLELLKELANESTENIDLPGDDERDGETVTVVDAYKFLAALQQRLDQEST